MRTDLKLLVVVMLSGCNQLFVEGSVSSLCEHWSTQPFSVPAVSQPVSGSLEKNFSFNLSVALPQEFSDAEFKVALSTVTLQSLGASDFGFIDRAVVTLLPPDDTSLSAKRVVELSKQAPGTKSIHFEGDEIDVVHYLNSGKLTFSVALEGQLPRQELNVDVDACAAMSLRYHYAQ